MSPAYRIAVVGTGGIADIHARDVASLGGRARIMAAADTDAERLASFAERWTVPHRYADLDALLENEDPDLVALCTPPGSHAAQAQACLARGRTVFVEKPPVLSLAELDDIARAEGAGGRFAAVVQHRFGSGAEAARRLTADPRVGPPMTAVCNTLWFRPDSYFSVPWRGRWEVEGGGPTLGHGIHQMDLMLSVLGPWRRVVAVCERRARPTQTEDVSAAIVTFENGAIATAVNSLLAPRETSYLRFDFANATVELEHLYGYGDDDWTVTAAPGHEDAVAAAWAAGPKGTASGHAAQLTAVFDAIKAGTAPPVSIPDVRPTIELVTAIYAASFTGHPVEAGEIGPDSPFYDRMDGAGAPWGISEEVTP